MQNCLKILLLLMLSGVYGGMTAQAREIVLQYHFHYNGLKVADVTERLTLSNLSSISDGQKTYKITSETKAEGLAKILYGDVFRSSEGIVIDQQLQATLFIEERQGKPKKAQYDIEQKQLSLSKKGEEKTINVDEVFFDYLTSIYQPHLLQQVQSMTINVTDGWRYKEYEYKRQDAESVETGIAGMEKMDAIPLVRESKRGKRTIWFAPDLEFLPVRSYIDEKGHVFETIIQSYSINE